MNTTNETTKTETASWQEPVRVVLETVRSQGATWARYGLDVGRLALETHAKTTAALAESLGKLAHSLGELAKSESGQSAPDDGKTVTTVGEPAKPGDDDAPAA